MIEPNFDLFLWLLLILFGIGAISHILLGAMNAEKTTRFGTLDAIMGLIKLYILIWIVIK